ncbi:Preprotein translocase subunit YajC (TC 3.A.5.1.1) [Trichlorobacter ammonificans]|uniref:Sec translocon accessory complex subunit YajC n=2 Tax=Trichlorobacter ammonificans TaxID=2916410 RepID=A0ABM9D938_9BACT|nr:Preprotein translocase subunit YajC (TC 3.A.5.1.1) [Trichlorobacter ammonificans]
MMTAVAFAMGAPAGGQAAQGGGAAALMNFVPLIFMFAIFYFLLIRPQQKKAKEHRAMLEALKIGDSVKTAGGIHGKIAALEDQVITLEVATGVKIKIDKPFVTTVVK